MSSVSTERFDVSDTKAVSRPNLCVIANEQTPYRIHFHRRIAREIREVCLHSIFTHELASSPWSYAPDEDINSVLFGAGESTVDAPSVVALRHQWIKGGKIIDWMQRNAFPSAIIVNGYNDLGLLRIIHWCRSRRIPCFLFGDSNVLLDSKGWKRWLKALLLPRVLKRVSGAFCCGRLGRAYFERYGVSSSRIWEVPYEPDYVSIQELGEELLRDIREHFGLVYDRRYLIYSGRLVAVKRVDLLLTAFKSIAIDRPNLDLIIAGDGQLAAELEAMVPQELRHRILWTGFVADAQTLAGLYRSADLLVLPSDYEPWGVVVTEAAAAGLGIIASSVVGSAADVVVPDTNGFIFRQGDVKSLEDALRRATVPGRLDELKQQSRVVFEAWRRENDPIMGLRNALLSALTL
jgi:glycosyltransferase involved in cell wall biosynthesis